MAQSTNGHPYPDLVSSAQTTSAKDLWARALSLEEATSNNGVLSLGWGTFSAGATNNRLGRGL